MIAMIGTDPQTGAALDMDSLYLWDGLPIVPLLLGVFALRNSRSADRARRDFIRHQRANIYKGQWQGVKDCFRNWWLILRCSWIGGGIGSIPGISAAVVDWFGLRPRAQDREGRRPDLRQGRRPRGDRVESSNNAKEGGALVPTVAFGVPGSATMAILLGAFLIHGLVPGPDMLTKNLSITYSMVWSVALANILGAGPATRSARIRQDRDAALHAHPPGRAAGNCLHRRIRGKPAMGRPHRAVSGLGRLDHEAMQVAATPFILGVVLGDTIERYMFISIERYGLSWMLRPVVAVLCILSVVGLVRPFLQDIRHQGGVRRMLMSFQGRASILRSCSPCS